MNAPTTFVRSHRGLRTTPARQRARTVAGIKRILLAILLAFQCIAYKVVTDARYEGQGLAVHYFRFSTLSDILSIGIAAITIALAIVGFIFPRRISPGRTLSAAIFSGILLWLDFGVRKFDASEFSPYASVVLVISMCLLIAVLISKSHPFLSPVARTLRIGRNVVLIFGFLALFSFIYSFTFPAYTDIQEITQFNADAGVVLGAAVWRGKGLGERPSPTLRQRIDVGYDLLTKNAIPRLVVTGASAPGEQTEAEIARKEFIKRGIEESKLIEETNSHSTLEQVKYIRTELQQKQGWSHFVIISDQYHLARVIEMCKFNGIQAIGSPSHIQQPIADLAYYRVRESVALLAYWLLGK